jgi:hypothetical protein
VKPRSKNGMQRSKVPWSSKLRPTMEPKVVEDPRGRGLMLVPTPLAVAGEISHVESGRLITPSKIRARLAAKYNVDLTCPLTTGIFLNIIAGAAEEQMARGEPPVAPYWRVVGEDGGLREKTPFGPERQAMRLREEGVETTSGEKIRVPGYEERLV